MHIYTKHGNRIKNMVLIPLFSVLIIICSMIRIPAPVPFTFQTFGVFCTFGIIGGKNGFFSVLVYIMLGLAGMPVFSGFTAGAGVLFGATGGFLIGFLLAAGIYALVVKICGEGFAAEITAMLLGQALCYLTGTVWYTLIYLKDTDMLSALKYCVLPFIFADVVKIILAVVCSEKVKARLKN